MNTRRQRFVTPVRVGTTPPHAKSARGTLPAGRKTAVLVVLAVAYLLSFVVMRSSATAGASMLVSVNVMLAMVDWQAFISLGGLIARDKLNLAGGIVIALILLACFIAPPIVLVRSSLALRVLKPRTAPLT